MRGWAALALAAVLGLGGVSLYATWSFDAVEALPDRAFSIEYDPARPLRVAFAGTSLTADYAWPLLLERRLDACLPGGARVSVHAKGGETSLWGQGTRPGIVAEAPDVVFIEFATNDADLRNGVGLEESRRLHGALIAGLREDLPKAAIVLMIMNPATGLHRAIRPLFHRYDLAYGDLADAYDTGLINHTGAWRALADRRAAFLDGVHPTDAASTAILVPALEAAILAAAEAGPCAG